MPDYLRGFDVATVPYRLTDYTHHVYPAKLNEYLAMGLGVVATPLAEIERFNREHGDIVRVATGPEAFDAAVATMLSGSTPADVQRRVDVARANSWTERLQLMSSLIVGALEGRALESRSRPCVASQDR